MIAPFAPEEGGWRDGVCDVGAVAIRYRRSGWGRPPLVALHGLLGGGACLVPMTRPLTNGFDVVLPDARGHGGSSAPDHGYRYCDLADDVARLIDSLGLRRPVLLGHSMGGLTAAAVAARLGPAIGALVLVDPTFISPERQRQVFESDIVAEHRRALDQGRETLIGRMRRSHPHRSPDLLERLVDARLSTGPSALEVLAPPYPDFRALIGEVRARSLLLIGDRGVVSLDLARELQTLNPRLCCRVVRDAGHGLPYDQPEAAGAAVAAFMETA